MKAAAFEYAKPGSLPEFFDVMGALGEDAKVLAGGQSLLAAMNMRLSGPTALVDINRLRELEGIGIDGGRIRIGALTRHAEVERSTVVETELPLLAQAVPWIAHPAIRNRGTIGGSVAFADPAAELPACCVALGAVIQIHDGTSVRDVEASSFFHGLYETDLAPGELLTAIRFPRRAAGERSAFAELARRHGDFALAGLAAHGTFDGDQPLALRLVFFGMGDRPLVAEVTADRLVDGDLSDKALDEAADRLDQDISADGSGAISAEGQMHLAKVLLRRVGVQLRQGKVG